MDNQLMYALIFKEFSSDNTLNLNQRMTKFLESIPNHFVENEKNFLVAMFLGGLYSFEYSEQKKDLEHNKDKIKSLYYYDQVNSTLHLVFVINDKQRYLRSIMLLPNQNNKFVLPEVLMKSLDFTHRSISKIIYNIDGGLLWESPILPLKLTEAYIDKEFIAKLTQHSKQKFVLVNHLSEIELHSENINENQTVLFRHTDIAIVEKAVNSYLNISQKVYQSALNDMVQSLGTNFVNRALFSQGFLFGELALVHPINAYAKPSIDNNFAELIIVYRASAENHNPYPILFKTNAHLFKINPQEISIAESLNLIQIVYSSAKLYEIDYCSHAIIANFPSQSSTIDVKSIPVVTPNQIISKFFLTTLSDEECKEILKYLFYINFQEKNLRNFFLQLLGFAISFYENDNILTKDIILWEDEEVYNNHGILVINNEAVSKAKTYLILDLRNKMIRDESEIDMNRKVDSIINQLIKRASKDGVLVRYIRVGIDSSKNEAEDFFSVVYVNDNPTFSLKSNSLSNIRVAPLNSIFYNQLFIRSESGKYNFNLKKLNESIKQFRSLIQQKSHFECLFKGMLYGLANKENIQIIFLGQLNNDEIKPIDGIVKIVEQLPNQVLKEKSVFIFNIQYENGKSQEYSREILSSKSLNQIEKYIVSLKNFTQLEYVEAIALVIDKIEFSKNDFLTNILRIIKIYNIASDKQLVNKDKLCNNRIDDNNSSISNVCINFKDAFYELSQLSNEEWINLDEAEDNLILALLKKGVKLDTIQLFKAYSDRVSGQLVAALIDQVSADERLIGSLRIETEYRLKKYISFLLLYKTVDGEIALSTTHSIHSTNTLNSMLKENEVFNSWGLILGKYFKNYPASKDSGKLLHKLASNPLIKPIIVAAQIYPISSFNKVLGEAQFDWEIRKLFSFPQKFIDQVFYSLLFMNPFFLPFFLVNRIDDAKGVLNHYSDGLDLSFKNKLKIFFQATVNENFLNADLLLNTKILMNEKLELMKNFSSRIKDLKAVVWYPEFPVIHKKYKAIQNKASSKNVGACTSEGSLEFTFDSFPIFNIDKVTANVFTETNLENLNTINYLPHYLGLYEDRKLVSVYKDFIDENVMPMLKQSDIGIFSWLMYPNRQPVESLILEINKEKIPDRLLKDHGFKCKVGTILGENKKFFYFNSSNNNPVSPFILGLDKSDAEGPIFYFNGGFSYSLPKNLGNDLNGKFKHGVYSLKAANKNPAIIQVSEALVYYVGSDNGTLFLLSNRPEGNIIGGIQQDIIDVNNLDISKDADVNKIIKADLANNKIRYFAQSEDNDIQPAEFELSGVEIYKGHSLAAETIRSGCNTNLVDGRGAGDLIMGSPTACSDSIIELRIVNSGDIHFLDPYKNVIYDIQPNVSAFLTHDKSKGSALNYPQIIKLNEKFDNLKFKKKYFEKIFNTDGELFGFLSAKKENFDVSDQGYVITTENKYLLMDAFGANVLFITTDDYKFCIFEMNLQDYFYYIKNQIVFEHRNKGNLELYDNIIEKPETHGLKIRLIKNLDSSSGYNAIDDAYNELANHESLPSIDSLTVLYTDEAKKVTTYVFGSIRQSSFFANVAGDYYFKTIGLSNIFNIHPPSNFSEAISQPGLQNIYIENKSELISENGEDNLLDLTGFSFLQSLMIPQVLESENDATYLQFKYISKKSNAFLELNIYLKYINYLKIKLKDSFYKLYILGKVPQTTILAKEVDEVDFSQEKLKISPPADSLNDVYKIQEIYIRDTAQLFSSKGQAILDLSGYNSFKVLLAPSIVKIKDSRAHLQYKYIWMSQHNFIGELNIYLEKTNYLKIELGYKFYVFDASQQDLLITQKTTQELPRVSALHSLPTSSESSWWPSVTYGLCAFAAFSVAIGVTKSWFFSPYRQVPQVNPDRREALAIGIVLEGLNQVSAVVRDFTQNAIYPAIDIKPAKIIKAQSIPANDVGKILPIENHTSTKSTFSNQTFQVDQPTFDLIRVMMGRFFNRGFNKRINKINNIQNSVAENDSCNDSFIQKHAHHLGRMHRLGIY